ncbi:MAG TPA: hypothetical protein VM427_06730 [Patescibacteria group bacterium]|nr:hypothetical protein [Patescibacteria group bacterium]
MTDATLRRIAGAAILAAALTAAAMTAAEIVTAPYNPQATLLGLDGPVHLIKYLAMVVLLVSLPAAFIVQRATAGRLGFAGIVLILFGLGAAGTPFNVLEMTLDPGQPVPALQATWDQLTDTALLGALGGVGFLSFLIGIVAFALATRRAGGAARSVAAISLVGLGIAFARSLTLDALPGVIPHPPAWMLLGLAAYGVLVWRPVTPTETVGERQRLLEHATGA